MNKLAYKKFKAARNIFSEKTTTTDKAQSLITLLKGIDDRLDKRLKLLSKSLSNIKKIQKEEYIELSAEHLPENTEKEKRRKRALIIFIKNRKLLQSEMEKFEKELHNKDSSKTESMSNMLTKAKGPYGLITIAAISIVSAGIIYAQKNINKETVGITDASSAIQAEVKTIKFIIYQDKRIPISEVRSVTGPECDGEPHYHTQNLNGAKTISGELIKDPNPTSCGFGKVSEVKIVEE